MTATKSCEACPAGSNVDTCSLSGYAETCVSGYYPFDGVCLECENSEDTCNPACLSLGFFNKGSSCAKCPANTLTCASDTVAVVCDTGYFLNAKAVC